MGAAQLFGLTGGVACGKSAVARLFRDEGLDVIDADHVARDVVEPGSEGLAAVVRAFGETILKPSGELDRKALGAQVFSDDAKRGELNAILHPRIAAATLLRAEALGNHGVRLACYEAALIVENGMADAFRPLVVVAASHPVQLARLRARDGLAAREAEARISAQCSLEEKLAVADYVIDNDGDLQQLATRAREVLKQVRAAHPQGTAGV